VRHCNRLRTKDVESAICHCFMPMVCRMLLLCDNCEVCLYVWSNITTYLAYGEGCFNWHSSCESKTVQVEETSLDSSLPVTV